MGSHVCHACSGTGVTEDSKTVKVKIPAKLQPGASLRLKGLGGKGHGGGPAGDLYLSIRVAPGSAGQIRGSDLETDLVIYPDQAVLGDKDAPRIEVHSFCDIAVARELLKISPEFLVFLPCRIAMVSRESNQQ